jgi:alkylation response protein AidB-like acyl-CoA dehydrogenase
MSSSALDVAFTYLYDEVVPKAQEIDRDPEALRIALQGLCDRDLMALKRPDAFGGPGLTEEDFRRFQEACARASGALAFLQTQHQSAVGMIARSSNDSLKQEYLPQMGNGGKLLGIGFSQLRRAGAPMIRARNAEGGYVLKGHVPWVTGWNYFPEFLVGATLDDGQALFAVVPLQESPGIHVSHVMELAAMQAANTVTVEFEDYFVPEGKIVFIQPAGWIQRNDQINIALQGYFAMGCAQAGLDVLSTNAERKPFPFLKEALGTLANELDQCRDATRTAQADANEETTQERLNVRAWAIDLAVRCAHAGVTSSSGAANSLFHPAQRVYREALVFTVSAQTPEIMEATLKRITRQWTA